MLKGTMRRRPSASMVVALLALIVAMSGTAVAASHITVNGDKVIRKHTISGNRLKNHTITGTQVNLKKLGKVPSAKTADSAGEANELGGHPASAFASSSKFRAVEGVTLTNGQSVTLAQSGPISLVANCTTGGSTPNATLNAASAAGNWLNNGTGIASPGTRPSDVASNGSTTHPGSMQAYSVNSPNGFVLEGTELAALNYPSPGQCYFSLTATS